MEKPKEPDLIDRIANGLPPEVRTEYYREMCHLRSLPENDEMLRILRAMMFLTMLTEQVPVRVTTEREKLESACNGVITTAQKLEATGSRYYQELDKRLTQLPVDIAKCINPKAIVENINDNLKLQFELSTIPTIAQELAYNAGTIRTATKEYKRASEELCGSWQKASTRAHEAINKINTAVSGAAESAKQATKSFTVSFNKTYNWALGIICAVALLAGIMIGILIFDRFRPYTRTIYEIPRDIQILLEQKEREKQRELSTPEPEVKPQPKVKPKSQPETIPVPKPKPEVKRMSWLEMNFLQYLPGRK
jgi:hypothetical protein